MYSFVTQKGSSNYRIVRVPTYETWTKYPYGQIVGTTKDPDYIRELIEGDTNEYPVRLLALEGKNVLLLQRNQSTAEYHVQATLRDRVLAERMVFKTVGLASSSVQIIAHGPAKTPSFS